MSRTKQETNRALVLEAFDTLLNKRDYEAAERYWSPLYIHTARTSNRAARVNRLCSATHFQHSDINTVDSNSTGLATRNAHGAWVIGGELQNRPEFRDFLRF